jgi:ABC-2 type transport system ATP-binding protein
VRGGEVEESTPIVVERVTKQYAGHLAVQDLSFSVPRGSVFGLIGPNGAGKTTTIRMMMNIVRPDSGVIRIFGEEWRRATSRLIGYVPEERGLYRRMRVIDQLVFFGELKGVPRTAARLGAQRWMERLGLAGLGRRRLEELSKGQQQQVQLISSLLHDPLLVILDEPFAGLDPVNAAMLRDLVRELQQEGKTLVVSTHIMEHAERLCDEILLIDRSRCVLQGPVTELKKRFSKKRLVLHGKGSLEALRAVSGVRCLESRDGVIEVELDKECGIAAFVRCASDVFELESVTSQEASLEDIFLAVVRARGAEGRLGV